MTVTRRLELIEWARRNDAAIIEDDYDSEYRYSGPPLPAMQGLAENLPVVYIGTFNLDPRSENLNTEVGVVIHDAAQAAAVAAAIDTDMLPANSWSAAEEADGFAPFRKRARVWLWSWLPLDPLL